MLINSLGLKNFKCFEELDVKFAPITLLTGANSSGKSSLIYALLAALQTEQFPFYLSPNGRYINLGGFEEMVIGKDSDKNITININLKSTRSLSSRKINFNTKWISDPNGLPVICEIDWKNSGFELSVMRKQGKYILNAHIPGVKIPVGNYKGSLGKRMKAILENVQPKDSISVQDDGKTTIRDAVFDSSEKMLREIILPIIESARFSTPLTFENFIQPFERRFFNYVGSFRLPPERTYYQKAKAGDKVLSSGEGYIDQIIEWEELNSEKFDELNTIMRDLELFEKIQSSKLRGGRFELNIVTKNSPFFSSLTDVGFGISQFLPVIVADLQLSDKSCLAISQPEIHLHPKIQAKFGDYLASQIKRTQKQYIVETHSEYLLNRIRLLLVTGELKPEDVRVLYFENDGVKSTVYDIEFSTDGQVKGAPAGFFDTYGIDVMNIAMSAIG